MRIGIDIDDVITDSSLMIKEYVMKLDKDGELLNYMEDIMRGDAPNPTIKKFFEENIIEIFKMVRIKENASEVIKRLMNKGNEVFIVTSRGEIKFKGSVQVTLEYFKLNDIKYTKILFDSFDKAKVCKENKIDLMIDDSEKYCREIQDANIRSILFTSKVNKYIESNVKRVENWLELEKIIENKSDN